MAPLDSSDDRLHILWKYVGDQSLEGYTLIVPSVAVGNVAQFTCDLIISSMGMSKLASVYSSAIIPVIGMDPYDMESSNMSNCCEIYYCPRHMVVTFQFRAPLVQKQAKVFLQNIVRDFMDKKVSDIIILSSSFDHEKRLIQSSPFRYVMSSSCPYKDSVASLGWITHEAIDGEMKIFGGGFAALLFEICNEYQLPAMVLFKYCSEGDNLPDAYDMVVKLAEIKTLFCLNQDIRSYLTPPASWKLLYGGPPPADLY